MARTARALSELGHRVSRVEAAEVTEQFDVLHAFHAEDWLMKVWPQWKRNRCAVVLSPVLTVRAGLEERSLRWRRRLPGMATHAARRAAALARADGIVALTQHERDLLVSSLGADPARVRVIGNGVDPTPDGPLRDLPDGVGEGRFVLMLGNVSARKRQAEVIAAAGDRVRFVVAGGFEGDAAEERRWQRIVDDAGAIWLGDLNDPATVRALQRAAWALVLLSAAEGQSLAVLETLAAGTPAILSDIPVHRELRDRFPSLVRLARAPRDVPSALEDLSVSPEHAAAIPSWQDVASELVGVYREAIAAWTAAEDKTRTGAPPDR